MLLKEKYLVHNQILRMDIFSHSQYRDMRTINVPEHTQVQTSTECQNPITVIYNNKKIDFMHAK